MYINTLCFRLPPPPSGTPPSRRRRASDTFVLTHLPLYHSDTLHFQPDENPLFPADRPPARKRASDFQHTAHAQKDSEILTNKIEIKPSFPRQKTPLSEAKSHAGERHKHCPRAAQALWTDQTSIAGGPYKHCTSRKQALFRAKTAYPCASGRIFLHFPPLFRLSRTQGVSAGRPFSEAGRKGKRGNGLHRDSTLFPLRPKHRNAARSKKISALLQKIE